MVTVNTPYTSSGSSADTLKCGLYGIPHQNCTLTKVTKNSSYNPTHCYLQDSSNNILASATFSGNEATFNYSLTQNTQYRIVVDSNGSNFNRITGAGTNSGDTTYFNFQGSVRNGSTDSYPWGYLIASIDLSIPSPCTVTPTALSLSTTAEEPTIIITIPSGALSLSITAHSPNVDIFIDRIAGTAGTAVARKPNARGSRYSPYKRNKDKDATENKHFRTNNG